MNIDYSGTHLGKKSVISKNERELLLVEYQRLRDEVNRTVDRMSRNEVVTAGFVFSLVFFHHQADHSGAIPNLIMAWSAATLAIFAAFFGHERSKVFRRHMEMVEEYLADLERRFSDRFGWTNFYRHVAKKNSFDRQTGTRTIFWNMVKFFALASAIVSLPSLPFF